MMYVFLAVLNSVYGADALEQCKSEHDPAFADVYYKNNVGQRVTLQSIYMTYGGTNWGHCKRREYDKKDPFASQEGT